MRCHIQKTVANCFAVLSDGQLRRQYTTRSSSLSSCHGSTTAMLCWWAYQPTCTTVCCIAARSIAGLRRSDHVTSTVTRFHWLKARSVFSSSWRPRQSSIVHWTVRLLDTWLQIYAVCLICRPDDVWDRHSLTSSMSVSRSVQLLETELSLWLVLDYRTVCHMTSSRVTTVTFPSWTQNIFI